MGKKKANDMEKTLAVGMRTILCSFLDATVLRYKLAERELPTIDEFIGSDPDFTGGKSTKDYIDEMRGG